MLETLWYIVLGAAMLFYVMLDGFDLGVGMLHLFFREDRHRRLNLNAIGPVWDGNEVWIVIVVGGMLAGFPDVYATVLSAFYLPVMALITGLIFRAVAIEFRSKLESKGWRSLWDGAFSIASFLIAFLLGIILANMVQGIALDEKRTYLGTALDFFTPYTCLMGLTSCTLFMLHGSLFLLMKLDASFHRRLCIWSFTALFAFIFCYAGVTFWTLSLVPHMGVRFETMPILLLLPVAACGSLFLVFYALLKRWFGIAFLSSCSSLFFLLSLYGIGTYPNLVISTLSPEANLTIYNAASSHKTLQLLLTIVAIGLPFVLAYGFWVYRIFRGKVTLHDMSY